MQHASREAAFTEAVSVWHLDGGASLVHARLHADRPAAGSRNHHGFLPPHLMSMVDRCDAQEWRWTLLSGRWAAEAWGPPPAAVHLPPSGTMLQAWGADVPGWRCLRRGLAGLVGAALDPSAHVSQARTGVVTNTSGVACRLPRVAPPLAGGASDSCPVVRTTFRPRDTPCTEHLAPWLRLWPCRDRSGVGALLPPRAVTASPLRWLGLQAWRDAVTHALHVAFDLFVVMPTPAASALLAAVRGPESVRCPAVGDAVAVAEVAAPTRPPPARPVVSQWLSGTDLSRRTLHVRVHNTGAGSRLTGAVVHQQPLYVRVLLSGAEVTTWCNDSVHSVRTLLHAGSPMRVAHMQSGGVVDGGAHVLRTMVLNVSVPPGCDVALRLPILPLLLNADDYPPDPHRGMDLPPVVLVTDSTPPLVVFSNSPLLELPTPDFSMPYNVITLVSTVVAFFMGTMLNVLSRKPRHVPGQAAASRVLTGLGSTAVDTLPTGVSSGPAL